MDDISDIVCGTKQQIQSAYDWLKKLDTQSLDWVFALDDIRASKKADGPTRIVVLRESAMRVQRMFDALRDTVLLGTVLDDSCWEKTAEIMDRFSDACISISRACARGQYSTQEFADWGKAHGALKDLIDMLLPVLEMALEQDESVSGVAVDLSEPPAPTEGANAAQSGEERLTLDERALALFFADKSRSKKDIADLLGKTTQSLSPKRCPGLDRAMKAWRSGNATARPHGTKDRDGNIEAWDEDE